MTKKIIIAAVILLAFLFKETAIILAFGMMPTIAVFAIDKSVGKSKTICVACMNFAGCFPFLIEFWVEFGQQTVVNAFRIVANVQNVIIIYMLAAGGYAIDSAVTGIMSTLLIQRSESRLKKIRQDQENLIDRWGEKVTGRYPLDDYGFPVKPIPSKRDYNPESDSN